MNGTVESLNCKRDSIDGRPTYGFICDEEGDSIFFIPTSMQMTSERRFDQLQVGNKVTFTKIANPPKGWRAIEVAWAGEGRAKGGVAPTPAGGR